MNMSPAQAKKIVLLSVLGLLIVATYRGRKGTVPTSTRLWGTGWLAVMLGVGADVAPQVAGPFALLVLVGSLTNGGDKAFSNLLAHAGAGTASASQGPPGPHGPVGAPQSPAPSPSQGPPGPQGPTG